jgi:hypothetical protein
MIQRHLEKFLQEWKNAPSRKPLILRGARQVGKTTLVNQFGKSFDQYLYFNLERLADRELFKNVENLSTTVQLLFLTRAKTEDRAKTTLIFIDEVQEAPKVLEALRFFYEDYPHLHVIVTGSLLEFALEKIARTPVGRVEFAELHPINFQEFLGGMDNRALLNLLEQVPVDNQLLGPIFPIFHEYAMIGGMPNITNTYLQEKNLSRVINLYAAIIEAYKSDFEKYAQNANQRLILGHIMDIAAFEIDNRITFNNFGNSSFKSREVKEAIGALEKAKILQLIYPTTNVALPALPDFKKSPRLQYLDVGLVNFQLGLHRELLQIKDLNESSRGKLIQQLVLQELKSLQYLPSRGLHFWVREEGGTSSEVDVVYPYRNLLIPIEIKSGASGSLRSLHEFMDRCPHDVAVRFYAGKISIDQLHTRLGKPYRLLNLPYFTAAWLEQYLDWWGV